MSTDITRQAGKGLDKSKLCSTPLYRERYEEIFERNPKTNIKRKPQSLSLKKSGLAPEPLSGPI